MILLLTHNDLDGVSCDIVLRCFETLENIRTVFCTYENIDDHVRRAIKEHDRYSKIYITDISVSEDVAQELDIIGHKVKLIDHHRTAQWLNKYKWAVVIERYNYNDTTLATSGAHLLFDILFNSYTDSNITYIDSGIISTSLMNLAQLDSLKTYVEVVRQYDTYEWKKNNNIEAKRLNDLFKIYGIGKFCEKILVKIKKGSCLFFDDIDIQLLEIENIRIEEYINRKKDEMIVITNMGKRVGVIQCENYISETGNRLCEIFKDEIDYILMINGTTISLRSINKDSDSETTDVSEIAKIYGGGGHIHAAGYTIEKIDLKSFYREFL